MMDAFSTSPQEPPSKEEELAEMEARAEEARQALSGMIFAALKMRGRKIRLPDRSLPLTIIAGFLGAGKTTLLNQLLVSPHGRRIAVLVNDFGRINIDAALVASKTDDMINLTNGCACCSVSSDLTNALIELAEREQPPEAIVLEASGIAEPNGIIHAALTNPAVRLEGSLVVVDAETLKELALDPLTRRLFHNQITAADLIVLSKVDLVDDARRAEARKWLLDNYPDKRVIEAVNGEIPAQVLLGIETKRDMQAEAPPPTDHAHDFESVSFTIKEPLDGERLHVFLETLPDALLRAKGVVNLAEAPSRRTIYQRVGKRWSYASEEPWGGESPHSSLVFIGPAGLLDKATLEAGLDACRVK